MRYHGGNAHLILTKIVREYGFLIATDHPDISNSIVCGKLNICRAHNQTKLPLISIEDDKYDKDITLFEDLLEELSVL